MFTEIHSRCVYTRATFQLHLRVRQVRWVRGLVLGGDGARGDTTRNKTNDCVSLVFIALESAQSRAFGAC